MKKKEEKTKPRVVFAAVGSCKIVGGKLGYRYLLLPNDWKKENIPTHVKDDDPRIRIFKKIRYYAPGVVLSVEAETPEGNSIYSNTAEHVGRVALEIGERWSIESRTVEDAHRRAKDDKKNGKTDFAFDSLGPWRKVYTTLRTSDQRTALISRMIAYVIHGKKS